MSFDASSDFILVDVKFNNVLPLKFIFDTGSEHTILFKKEYADLLGVQYDKRIPLMGSDLSQEIYGYIARGVNLHIGNTFLSHNDILVLEEDYLKLEEFTGVTIDGIIGASLFKHFVIHVNNRSDKIEFIDVNRFKPPRKYEEMTLDIISNKPYVEANGRLGVDTIPLRLLLDTGAGLPLLLYTNTSPKLHLPEQTIQGSLGMGLGGNLQGYIGRMEHFSFHEYEFGNLVTSFQDIEIGEGAPPVFNRNGILGNSILKRFNYYIDYHNETIYMRPISRLKKKFKFDKSGLVIAATGKNLRTFIIQRILEDTPAAEADIRRGDVIKRIEGIPAALKTLPAITAILSSREGRKVTLILDRDNERIKKKIKLRKII